MAGYIYEGGDDMTLGCANSMCKRYTKGYSNHCSLFAIVSFCKYYVKIELLEYQLHNKKRNS